MNVVSAVYAASVAAGRCVFEKACAPRAACMAGGKAVVRIHDFVPEAAVWLSPFCVCVAIFFCRCASVTSSRAGSSVSCMPQTSFRVWFASSKTARNVPAVVPARVLMSARRRGVRVTDVERARRTSAFT